MPWKGSCPLNFPKIIFITLKHKRTSRLPFIICHTKTKFSLFYPPPVTFVLLFLSISFGIFKLCHTAFEGQCCLVTVLQCVTSMCCVLRETSLTMVSDSSRQELFASVCCVNTAIFLPFIQILFCIFKHVTKVLGLLNCLVI
jgi:hypothetical protein